MSISENLEVNACNKEGTLGTRNGSNDKPDIREKDYVEIFGPPPPEGECFLSIRQGTTSKPAAPCPLVPRDYLFTRAGISPPIRSSLCVSSPGSWLP
jgi:hypothetical protein